MPSDPRAAQALRALAGPIERYRSAVASAVEEVRGYLARHRSAVEGSDGGVAAELGPFAVGRIDLPGFSTLFANSPALDPATVERIEGAYEILHEAAAGGDEAFCVNVEAGGRLRQAVGAALEEAGRVFSAARFAARVKAGGVRAGARDGLLGPLRFEGWNEAERRLAPPLVVQVEGADLQAGDLAEFLDAGVKIVLVVRGECAPAPLVRLITPGTVVVQTENEKGLERVANAEGPAVAALVPEAAARFIHDPSGGPEPWDRIELLSVPGAEPKRAIGGRSLRQQVEELGQLLALARRPTPRPAKEGGGPAAAAPAEEADPVDRLAAWLLSQANLSEFE